MNQMTITTLLWGRQGEYMIPIHSDQDPTNTRGIDRKRPSLTDGDSVSAMKDLLLGACLCNNAVRQSCLASSQGEGVDNPALNTVADETSSKISEIVGDAADVALYHLCNDNCSLNIEQVKKVNPRINSVPFNSKNKFMITANLLDSTSTDRHGEEMVLVTLKGAPELILPRCHTYKHDSEDKVLLITDEVRTTIHQRQEKLGESGYRVLAMLQQQMSKREYDLLISAYKTNKSHPPTTSHLPTDEIDLNGLPTHGYCFIGRTTFADLLRMKIGVTIVVFRHVRTARSRASRST